MSVEPPVLQYPSLNEVNYELYGFLEYQRWHDDYKNGRPMRPYIKQCRDGSTRNERCCLTDYVRHQIHHPENTLNSHYTEQELKTSIEDMRIYIRNRAEQEGLWSPIQNDE